ncbi:ferredoxin-type protein NapF [Deefgea chitinilytica]|uniref:Ferredoxin-type protein NapF n=1 Tax=Deefgea chitinilytica TaxID=570276 RepID=A0ABS2CC08_9NEIS|nr:ferredoxin-type protein NapF [Deefgea chitinilytica]MBM9888919.1 ferredoxin-type protein NapF [Deefgea sp. CFH1-16]
MVDTSRRNLLFGRKPQTIAAPRPPWSKPNFVDICTRCGDCVSACPTQIIRVGDAGFPTVDFAHGECSFCGECSRVCNTKAIEQSAAEPWSLRAVRTDNCLALKNIECRICGEVCDVRAIRFELAIGKVAKPHINTEQCTGCGACVAPCPSQSLNILEITT